MLLKNLAVFYGVMNDEMYLLWGNSGNSWHYFCGDAADGQLLRELTPQNTVI